MKENLFEKNKIRTFTGRYIDVFDLKPEDICIDDIAHALSCINRFGGHLPVPYTVAQHSIGCCQNIGEYHLEALLHDSAEAYLSDIPSPIKNRLPDYKALEEKVLKDIFDKFGLIYPLPQRVKDVDKNALKWEWENIMLRKYGKFDKYTFEEIRTEFLNYFYMYWKND